MTTTRNDPTSSFTKHMRLNRTTKNPVRRYLEARLANVEMRESDVQAFVCLNTISARRAADASDKRWKDGRPLSPIDGLPIGAKDIIQSADFPTHLGTSHNWIQAPQINAACLQAAKDGGAILVGKLTTTAFAISGVSTATRNPHNLAHTPGGSSSGTAAAVGSGMLAAAFGTQTQGSLIRPASYCGAIGMKPTWGTLSVQGIHPVASSLDHLGLMASDIGDLQQLLSWLGIKAPGPGQAGQISPQPASPKRPKRAGLLITSGIDELSPASRSAFETAIEQAAHRGVEIVTPERHSGLKRLCLDLERVPDWSLQLIGAEMQWPYREYLTNDDMNLDQRMVHLVEQGRLMSPGTIQVLYKERLGLMSRCDDLMKDLEVLLLPAASGPAPLGLENSGSRTNLVYATFLGLPCYSLPVMQVNGLPFGLQVIGQRYRDISLGGIARWWLDNE